MKTGIGVSECRCIGEKGLKGLFETENGRNGETGSKICISVSHKCSDTESPGNRLKLEVRGYTWNSEHGTRAKRVFEV